MPVLSLRVAYLNRFNLSETHTECKPKEECEPLVPPRELLPGEELVKIEEGCCPTQKIVCKPEKCPPAPANCQQRFYEVYTQQETGVCCATHKCGRFLDKPYLDHTIDELKLRFCIHSATKAFVHCEVRSGGLNQFYKANRRQVAPLQGCVQAGAVFLWSQWPSPGCQHPGDMQNGLCSRLQLPEVG